MGSARNGKIHQGKDGASFVKPDGIVSAEVCRVSGCLASEGCTDTYYDIFTSDNMPPKCEGHGSQEVCTESGKLANEYCPEKETQYYGVVVPKERLNLWTPLNGSAQNSERMVDVCDIHKKPEEPKPEPTPTPTPEPTPTPKPTENKTTENKTKENKTTENKTTENKTTENKTTENKTTENKTKENKTTENKTDTTT